MTNYTKLSKVRKLIVLPAALTLIGAVSVASGGERQIHVVGGKMATRVQNGKMVLTGVQGKVGGGQVHMAGRVGLSSEKPNTATVKFDDLSLAKAATMIGQPGVDAVLGDSKVSGFAKGRWQGEGLKEISASANGTLTVETGPGVITDTETLSRLAKLTGIDHLPELRYTSIKLQARAADGNVVIDSITATGPNFRLAAKGTYVSGSDDLDMKIAASVSPAMAAKSSYMKLSNVMGFLRGEDKPDAGEFVDIPRLIVSGDLKTPEVSIDKTHEIAAKAEVSDAKPAIPDSVKRASNFLLSQAK